jgi:4-aminobutyrate aminotransferase-like enzyme
MFFHAPFPMACHNVNVKESLKGLENIFKVDIAPSDVASIIVEPLKVRVDFIMLRLSFYKHYVTSLITTELY